MQKIVPCPVCGSRILDAEENVCAETQVLDTSASIPSKTHPPPELYAKCWKCKAKIGLRKVEIAI